MMLSAKEVALACDVSAQTVRRWIKEKGLPARRAGFRAPLELDPIKVARWCEENNVPIHNPFCETVAS